MFWAEQQNLQKRNQDFVPRKLVHFSPIKTPPIQLIQMTYQELTMSHTTALLLFAICPLISIVGLTMDHGIRHQLTHDLSEILSASTDFGGMTHGEPMAVFRPNSDADVASLVRDMYESSMPVSARGHGHSINGQAQAVDGIVVKMTHHAKMNKEKPVYSEEIGGYYVDVWGGELWIDVLNWTLENGGLAPKSWTDYLYLTVGGTLSNAGISGQAFQHGPQINNVYELDVVTGKGEKVTCSENVNSELFHGVLGGLGQYGIITRARIALEQSPQRVKWIRVVYSNFTTFTKDQEYLISLQDAHRSKKFDYVEGFVIVDEGLINNWRSSFFSPRNPVKISSINGGKGEVLYCLEMTKNYDDSTASLVDQEVDTLLEELRFIPNTVFTTDLPYVDFLDRVHKAELKLRAKGLWEVPHPWLNLFVPSSRIIDFDQGIFRGMLGNKTSGPIHIYPFNKNKWDERSSVVTPNEEVFYLVAFLRTAVPGSTEQSQNLEYLKKQNEQILKFCSDAGIEVKQYLPNYSTITEWKNHYGDRWERFVRRKIEFDPKRILGTGQGIFHPSAYSPLFPS